MENKEPDIKRFDKCPACGSTERFVGDLAKEQDLKNADMYGLNSRPGPQGTPGFFGPIVDAKTMAGALIGSKFPLFAAPIDACSVCGCVYTIRQEIHTAKKALAPPNPNQSLSGGPFPGFKPPPGVDPFKMPGH